VLQEFQKDNRNLVISETEMKQCVYIYKCENSTIQIKGKVNAITLGMLAETGTDTVIISWLLSELPC